MPAEVRILVADGAVAGPRSPNFGGSLFLRGARASQYHVSSCRPKVITTTSVCRQGSDRSVRGVVSRPNYAKMYVAGRDIGRDREQERK